MELKSQKDLFFFLGNDSQDVPRSFSFFFASIDSFLLMSLPKIHYFGLAGRQEFVKLLFEEKGEKYEFVLHSGGSHKNVGLPFGQLPLYEEGDFKIVQTATIVHYVAKKFGKMNFLLTKRTCSN